MPLSKGGLASIASLDACALRSIMDKYIAHDLLNALRMHHYGTQNTWRFVSSILGMKHCHWELIRHMTSFSPKVFKKWKTCRHTPILRCRYCRTDNKTTLVGMLGVMLYSNTTEELSYTSRTCHPRRTSKSLRCVC